MTPEQATAKRNELNALARKAEVEGNEALASRCRILGTNLRDMVSEDPATRDRATAGYAKNKADLEEWLTKTGKWSPEFQAWVADPGAPSAENVRVIDGDIDG